MMLNGIALAGGLSLLAGSATAQSSGRPGHGLIGYGITMYKPGCAHACRSSLPRAAVPCDVHLHGHHSSSVSTDCLARSEAYLLSAAWCLHTRCAGEGVAVSALEEFWETELVGRELEQPSPMWTYQQALRRARDDMPTEPLGKGEVFNRTALAADDVYISNWNGNTGFENVETLHQTFSIVVLLAGAGIPIALSLLRFLPFPPTLVSKFYAYIIEPPAFGRHHASPILGLGLVPTRGQALFILYILAINVVLTSVGYESLRPNSWYVRGTYEEITNYVGNRAGMLSFANLPLVFLFAGRNNVLLWLTNWSHSTFLLLHRWIAMICMIQAVLHSAIWLHIHSAWKKDHAETAAIPYWYWGIIATLSLVIIFPLSVLPLRKKMYEFFHATHIIFAILAVVGCWYHIIYRYKRQWGYENWVIAAAVVWAFDWVLRMARVLGNGTHTAFVTKIDDEYIRIDVPGVYCQGHAYAYFPTLSWRIWESHPLSVAGIAYKRHRAAADEFLREKRSSDSIRESMFGSLKLPDGVAFLVRVEKGVTSLLAKQHGNKRGIPILLEAYSAKSSVSGTSNHVVSAIQDSRTIFIAGGVGITNILPKMITGQTIYQGMGPNRLYWGVRAGADGLVKAVQDLVEDSGVVADQIRVSSEGLTSLVWGNVDTYILVGERFDLRSVLATEISESQATTVVVCGPAAMADEVRMVVTSAGRHDAVVKLVEESFIW
jgi:predicted ferric reductase